MPKGVYPRTKNQLEASKANLAKGREAPAREKANATLKKIAENPEWREKVSQATQKAMHSPEIREKHLKGLLKARQKYGVNFRGGNGQELTKIVKLAERLFSQYGFIREYPITTKTVKHIFKNAPTAYKADFANPIQKIVIELDGVSHHPMEQKKKDRKKTKILTALGWNVIRLVHCSHPK